MLIKKIPDTSGSVTTTVLNTKISEVENKIPDTSNLVTTTVLITKISEVENKIPNHDKYTKTPKFHKLTAESFAARLKQADLVNKTDFDNKLTRFNRRITSNKKKHLEVQKKLDILIKKRLYIFFLRWGGGEVEFILNVMMDLKTHMFIKQQLIR